MLSRSLRLLACLVIAGVGLTARSANAEPEQSVVQNLPCASGPICFQRGRAARLGVAPEPRNPALALELLQAGCALDNGNACNELAIMRFTGDGVAADQAAAYPLFVRGCRFGALDACFNQAQRLERGEGVTRDSDQARALMAYACGESYAPACYTMGNQLSDDTANRVSQDRARDYYRRACENGLVRGCAGLEIMDRNDAEMRGRRQFSQEENLRLCDGGNLRACNNAAFVLATGTVNESRFASAAALFGKACDGGNRISCYNLGTHHFSGLPWADRRSGVAAFWKACLADDFISCEIVADHYTSSGEGRFAPDYEWAAKVWTYLCARNRAQACAELGEWQLNGTGLPADRRAAMYSFQRACRLDSLWGCYRVALLRTVPGRHARTVRLMRHVCRQGHARACNDAGYAGLQLISSATHRRGSVLPDFQRAVALDPLDASARRQVVALSGAGNEARPN
jgi:uncharacterized protein